MEKIAQVIPASKNLVGGAVFKFTLKGLQGAVHFAAVTDWYHPPPEERNPRDPRTNMLRPDGYEVAYHSPIQEDPDLPTERENCPYLDGRTCYSDGSLRQAREWVPQFLEGGTNWLWGKLLEEYKERFPAGEQEIQAEQLENQREGDGERILEVIPAHDSRGKTPNYGQANCVLAFVLKRNGGAVHLTLMTDWGLPHMQQEVRENPDRNMLNKGIGPAPPGGGIPRTHPPV